MKLFLTGFLIGIGKILPGISGSVLAIRLGVYERVIESITSFWKDKKHIIYLSILGSGFLLAVILGSKVLLHLFLEYAFLLKILFFLFLITGIPDLIKKGNSWLWMLIGLGLGILLFLLPTGNIPVSYFTMGVLESISTIIPGLSGTAIYLSLGWYEEVLHLFSQLYSVSLCKLIPFLLGVILGAILLLRIMRYLLEYHTKKAYSFILGLFLSSLFFLF